MYTQREEFFHVYMSKFVVTITDKKHDKKGFAALADVDF